MAALTGRQRVSATFKKTFTGQEAALDRVAAYPIMGQANAQLIGASIRDFVLNPRIMVEAQEAAYERYRPDIIVMQGDLLMDVEAMGNQLKFPENGMPISTRMALEDKHRLKSLHLPDPTRDGRMPGYLEALAEAKKRITDAVVSAVVAGPWTIAIGLRGANELIRDALKDPQYVHELMAFTTQMSIRFGEAVAPLKTGLSYSEAPASCSLISPRMFRGFVKPYLQQLVNHFKAQKVGVGLHICGYADPILEDIVEIGGTNISVDAPTDLAKAAEAARGKAVLIGNVNTNLFFSGTRPQMAEAMTACLQAAGDIGYILATGCEVPGVAPPEKIDWFMELAAELGSMGD